MTSSVQGAEEVAAAAELVLVAAALAVVEVPVFLSSVQGVDEAEADEWVPVAVALAVDEEPVPDWVEVAAAAEAVPV